MEKKNLDSLASMLHEARLHAKPVAQISKDLADFSRHDAYAIQERQTAFRLNAGEQQIGWKMGLTSAAKRAQMNLDSSLYGVLTDKMAVEDGGEFSLKNTIHPKIEPEIAFLIGHDLKGQVTREQALAACTAIASCMEILDSRYDQFKYFSMEDVIADNSSSSHFILGPWLEDFKDLDLLQLEMKMSVNGQVAQSGWSKDISGDPVVSIIELCQLLAERDQILKAGSIVLAGAATIAVQLEPGQHVSLSVDHLPPVAITVAGEK